VRIGIVGSGHIGGTAARLFEAAGHEVEVSNSRGDPHTVEEAAQFGELVLVAIPLHAVGSLPPEPFAGKVVVDANNYYPGRDGQIAELDSGELTSSELLARQLPEATVVKAFNTMNYKTLAEAGGRDEPLAIYLSGDDPAAKAQVADLIEAVGFAPVDMGSLREGGVQQQPGTPVYAQDLTVAQARERLGGP
jgi:8-hydroxy-5-deazaflavin:NADPH oxidoreductase